MDAYIFSKQQVYLSALLSTPLWKTCVKMLWQSDNHDTTFISGYQNNGKHQDRIFHEKKKIIIGFTLK
jgi:hypothetical protein